MISPPQRRIWMYPSSDGTLEVILLGSLSQIAWEFSVILKTAENWPGFVAVEPISVGSTVLGLRCHLDPSASHADPVAEGQAWLAHEDSMIRRIEINWDGPVGKVGTW